MDWEWVVLIAAITYEELGRLLAENNDAAQAERERRLLPARNADGTWRLMEQRPRLSHPHSGPIRRDLPQTFRIQNKSSALYIGIREASKNPGEGALQWDIANDGSQDWTFEGKKIRNANSGLYLGVREASMNYGADIIQWNSSGDGSQDWKMIFHRNEDGCVRIMNEHSGKFWGIYRASPNRGELLKQWDPTDYDDQKWRVVVSVPGARSGSAPTTT